MNLPELPKYAVARAVVYEPQELEPLMRAYGEACFRAGMERAIQLCQNVQEHYTRHYEIGAKECEAAIRGEAERKDER